ncbi:nucleoid-associated protein YejK [Thalassotalea mangrovi]|uniref:Nucleoid-associated protein YejK n=1 Tax=Thalassotalea mangrovi TaxID=2572245 RepID=A0A4U1B4F5_9GAMM|nr:nucleoid-associated protein YejK [Thalassotalea mangrovi]TKB44903.1 nucleoid-associated protein YejK [Thalassotalea mangrovi]
MSLIINKIDLRFVAKPENEPQVTITTGDAPVAITPKINAFIEDLHSIYNAKGSKAYGGFKANQEGMELAPFHHSFDDYLNEQLEFSEFCNRISKGLAAELEKYDLAETGYLLTCHYEMLSGRYLLVAMLPVTEHFYVDGELNISSDQHIDSSKLQLAVRIDLFDYADNPDKSRYISFIKGRAGRKVADFFLDFLGCEEGIDAKQQSQVLIHAVEEFVNVQQLNAEEKQQTRKEMLSYCKEQQALGKDVQLQELSESLPNEDNGDAFYQFCKQNDYPLEESFPHDQATINKATKYSGYGAGISISFERSHFGQDVVYNPENESLTIYRVPPNLKDQLLKLLSSNDE